jgi:hypothetical protein
VVLEINKYLCMKDTKCVFVTSLQKAAVMGASLHTKHASTGNLECVFACSVLYLTS